jgi:hypothetical protein
MITYVIVCIRKQLNNSGTWKDAYIEHIDIIHGICILCIYRGYCFWFLGFDCNSAESILIYPCQVVPTLQIKP